MRMRAVFGEAFLDGFTMAGFLNRLSRSGEPVRLFEPPEEERESWPPCVFEMGAGKDAVVAITGDLHSVPEPALREIIQLLRREDEGHHASSSAPA